MNLLSPNTVLLALLVLVVSGMIFPTGAAPDGAADTVWEEPAIALSPAPGPNGQYAQLGPDDNLTVNLDDVNVGASTVVREVFTITNNDPSTYQIWVTHDGADAVALFVGGQRSLEDDGNPVTLDPGSTRSVSVAIDTRGRSPNETLMTELTLHATLVTTPTPTPTESDSGSGGTGSGGVGSTATPVPTEATATPTGADEETVEVVFGVETIDAGDDVDVREMAVEELQEDPNAPPRAVIDRSRSTVDADVDRGPSLRASGAVTVAAVGESVDLSGSRSVVGQVSGVDSRERIVKLVDIEVPPDRRDQPGTVRMRVAREKFGETDASEATIAHRTEAGWQLLDTRVMGINERTVTLEAETDGFSPFAVFVTNEVSYEWTLPDGTVFEGRQLRAQFDEPGRYNVTLTITDAFGRSDTAIHNVLVNDQPTVAIEGLVNASRDGPATLRANVTNEVGNVTVTWTFADGSTTMGETVTRSFDSGETVRVVVEDEFGAQGRAEGVVGQPLEDGDRPSIGVVQFNLGLQSRISILGLAVILLVMGLRWLAVRRYHRY